MIIYPIQWLKDVLRDWLYAAKDMDMGTLIDIFASMNTSRKQIV